jgi:riboflavin kinase/FMN adenylyltransferase
MRLPVTGSPLPPGVAGTVVTVGAFDGLHRGHRAVLDRVCARARGTGAASLLVTFEPHPLRVLRPEMAPRRLTTPDERRELLALTDLDYVAVVPFTPALARLGAEEFVDRVLLERFRMRELVIGYDHGLGRGREGDAATLREIGRARGFAVHVVPAVELDGAPISARRIRDALASGDVEWAARALGRPYTLTGTVVRGAGRGRALGFPTANLAPLPPDKLVPRDGIYAVRAAGREPLGPGLLHLGPRPAFPGSPPSIEVHLLEFQGELYGERLRVEILRRLRDVLPFASVAELVAQMERDREAALQYFRGRAGLQEADFGVV